MSARMQSSIQVASSLLAVEQQKERAASAGFPAAPVGLGILNLAFCVVMENFIHAGRTDHHMLLFMFIECSGVALVCCGVFVRSMSDIVTRTSVFPIGTWSYLLFIFGGFAKRPVVLALLLTTCLFAGVLFYGSILRLVLDLSLLVLAITVILATVAVVSLFLIRSMQPAAMFGLLAASAAVGIVGATLVFDMDSLLRAVPVVGWTVQGFSAVGNGDISGSIRVFLYDLVALVALALLGRRIR